MNELKKETKKEIYRNIRNIVILLIVIGLLSINLNITNLFGSIKEYSRIHWLIDFSLLQILVSIFISIILYLFHSNRLFIDTKIVSMRDESDTIVLNTDDPVRAFLNIEIEGKRRELQQELKIVFPEWLDVQPENLHYIKEVENNVLLISIDEITKNREKIKFKRVIFIDLIRTSSVKKNEEEVYQELKLNYIQKAFIKHNSKTIKIKLS
ncbi:hypothetical protein BFM98_07185 [Lysinibacillus sp. AR18-8]|uniref:hypothetical protein n=1 Tax=Lysinibacillus sp. AR18-8 TaxID=1889781 RepID=UPI000826594D|nr:hypothetical protein [Lysinibacillus sp. AR18-8]OCX64815.1 hypothetical protein BFM98_07185 [Lysinibacillus sp. AR18-8]